jgi:hypothetical protein
VIVLYDYLKKLKEHVNNIPAKKCKGVPYKRIKGVNIFVDDLGKKIYAPIKSRIVNIGKATSYAKIYAELEKLMRDMIALPYNTPKSKMWIDAYKGEGAYYTLKNLVMFHDCRISENNVYYGKYESMELLKKRLVEYEGEGWRMFALMNKVIKDNNFDFHNRMEEIYN